MAIVPASSGTPTSVNSKKPNVVAAGSVGGLGHDDVHRRAGEGQHRAGVGGEGQRHQQLRRRLAAAARP